MSPPVAAVLGSLLVASLAGGALLLGSLHAARRTHWSGHVRHLALLCALVTTAGIFVVTAVGGPRLTACLPATCSMRPPAALSDRTQEFYTVTAAGKFADLAPAPPTASTTTARGVSSRLALVLALAWLAGVTYSLARIARRRWLARRIVRDARPVDDAALATRTAAVARRIGVRRAVRLLRHPAVGVPSVTGTARPALLLSPGFEALPPATAEMVLVHELAHVRRADARATLVGDLVTALFWFHPLVRRGARRMRELQEVAADSYVISHGVRPSAYAGFLLDTLRRSSVSHAAALAGSHSIVGHRPLDERLRAILDHRSRHASPSRSRAAAVTMAFVVVGAVLAWTPAALQALGARARQQRGYGDIDRSLLNPASLDSLVRPVFINTMADRYVAGAAIAIVHEGGVLYQAGFGRREVFQEDPVDARRTIWRIGSITKVLTGVAVMQLVDRGLLDLDADVNRYVTAFEIPSPFGRPIRVRHLLTHTAGFDQIGLGRHVDRRQAVRPLGDFLADYLHPIRPPGEVSCYDTYGITLAGYLVEQVSGIPYERYLTEHVFRPLAMHRSGIEMPEALSDDVAVGYEFAGSWEAQRWEYMNTDPASTVNATVGDMANFMIMMLEDGRFDGRQILTPSSATAMLTRQFTNHPDQPGYGYTFFEDRSFGLPGFSHGGSMTGYGAFLYLVPDERLGVFIATNQESGAVHNAVLSALLSGLFPDRPRAPPRRPRLERPVDLSRFLGTYASNMYHHADPATGWRIRPFGLEADSLGRLVFDGAPAFPVGPLSFQRDDGVLLTFRQDDTGAITHLFVNQTVYERIR